MGQRDLLCFSTKCVLERVDQPDLQIVIASDTDKMDIFYFANNLTLASHSFKGGWALDKKHGSKYGRKYVGPFKPDIEHMFIVRLNNNAKRIGKGRMLNHFRKKYPGRFDLPSETEIRQAISILAAKEKKG